MEESETVVCKSGTADACVDDSDPMPDLYQIQFMPSDLQNIYCEILNNVTMDNVFASFANYVVNNIEPIGWKAIWKPSSLEYPVETSLLVNVVDVYADSLEASVVIMKLLHPNKCDLNCKELAKIEQLMEKTDDYTVPLIDLYVISSDDNENEFYETANIIEHVRFFYKNIWRPWDDFNENNHAEYFVSTRLLPRLALLCDIKTNVLTENLKNRFNYILSESFAIKSKMDYLNNKFKETGAGEGNVGDELVDPVNDFITDMDATEFIKLKMKLESLEREMNIIEDHHLRNLYNWPESINNNDNLQSIHLVSSNLICKTLSKIMITLSDILQNDPVRQDWPIKIHSSLQQAIDEFQAGDIIYITSGTYSQPLSWIEKNIELVGIDDGVEITSNKDTGDIFLFFNSSSTVKISNVNFRAEHQLNYFIVVKSGDVILDSCTLDGYFQCTNDILVAPSGGSFTKNQCKMLNFNQQPQPHFIQSDNEL